MITEEKKPATYTIELIPTDNNVSLDHHPLCTYIYNNLTNVNISNSNNTIKFTVPLIYTDDADFKKCISTFADIDKFSISIVANMTNSYKKNIYKNVRFVCAEPTLPFELEFSDSVMTNIDFFVKFDNVESNTYRYTFAKVNMD